MPKGVFKRKVKTHCGYGHEYTPENTVHCNNGYRRCLACIQRNSLKRSENPGIGKGGVKLARTDCDNGHPYTPENTYQYVNKEGRVWRTCRICMRHRALGAQQKRKKIIIAGYGGKCAWPGCEVNDSDMLTIDHVNDDGAQERTRGVTSGHYIYRKIVKENFPPCYQILCANHNLKKEMLRARRMRLDRVI